MITFSIVLENNLFLKRCLKSVSSTPYQNRYWFCYQPCIPAQFLHEASRKWCRLQKHYLLWWGTQMSAFPCDDMPQQNTIFFVNRSTCFIKLNVGWFSKAEALSILVITQEEQHRRSIPCCSFIIIFGNALHPVIAIDYAIGAAHSLKAARLLGNQLFQQPHPTWPLLFGYAQGSTANFKYNKSMEQMCKLNLKIQ